MSNVIQLSPVKTSKPEDRLGELLEQIKTLEAEAESLKADFRDQATLRSEKVASFAGDFYVITVSSRNKTDINKEAVFEAFGLTGQIKNALDEQNWSEEQKEKFKKVSAQFPVSAARLS